MNRYNDSSTYTYLSRARDEKMKLIPLDNILTSIQHDLFMRKIQGKINIDTLLIQQKKLSIQSERRLVFSAIAQYIYSAISDLQFSILTNIRNQNTAFITSDDNEFYNITYFISEYYQGDEIKNAIIDKFRFSMIQSDLDNIERQYRHISLHSNLYLPPLSGLSRFRSIIHSY